MPTPRCRSGNEAEACAPGLVEMWRHRVQVPPPVPHKVPGAYSLPLPGDAVHAHDGPCEHRFIGGLGGGRSISESDAADD